MKTVFTAALLVISLLAAMSFALQTSASTSQTIVVHGHTIYVKNHSTLTHSVRRAQIAGVTVTYTTYVYTAQRIYWCTDPGSLSFSYNAISYTVAWTVLSSTGQIVGYYNPGDPSFSWGGLGCGLSFSIASNSASEITPGDVHWYAGFNDLFLCPVLCAHVGTDFISVDGYSSGGVSAGWS